LLARVAPGRGEEVRRETRGVLEGKFDEWCQKKVEQGATNKRGNSGERVFEGPIYLSEPPALSSGGSGGAAAKFVECL
jgi:hypothetical protein